MKKLRFFIAPLLVLILLLTSSSAAWSQPPTAPSYNGCGEHYTPVLNAEYEQKIIEITNQERAQRGLPPMKHVTALDEASRYHAADMAQDRYFNHDTYDRVGGQLEFVCGTFYRISHYYTEWLTATENLAGGQSSPAEAVAEWMDSPDHRANILSKDEWEIGAGFYQLSNSVWDTYWTQEFGRRQGRFPLIINSEVASTDSVDVSLYIYGDFDEMKLSNDGDNWTDWQAFQNQVAWNLGGSIGEHTVYAKMRSSGGSTYNSKDTIILNKAPTVPTLGGMPDMLTFFYSISDSKLTPDSALLAPANVGNTQALKWSTTSAQAWTLVNPNQGETPDQFSVIPVVSGLDVSTPRTYNGTVTVTVTDPSVLVNGTPHTINVVLQVMNTPPQQLYMPLIAK